MNLDLENPVFEEPWQARAFALAISLQQQGVFTWPEWTAALSTALARSPQPEARGSYYHAWLQALEPLVAGLPERS